MSPQGRKSPGLMMENWKRVCLEEKRCKKKSIKIALWWEEICYCPDEIKRGNWHCIFFFNILRGPAAALIINNMHLAAPLVIGSPITAASPSREDKCDLN